MENYYNTINNLKKLAEIHDESQGQLDKLTIQIKGLNDGYIHELQRYDAARREFKISEIEDLFYLHQAYKHNEVKGESDLMTAVIMFSDFGPNSLLARVLRTVGLGEALDAYNKSTKRLQLLDVTRSKPHQFTYSYTLKFIYSDTPKYTEWMVFSITIPDYSNMVWINQAPLFYYFLEAWKPNSKSMKLVTKQPYLPASEDVLLDSIDSEGKYQKSTFQLFKEQWQNIPLKSIHSWVENTPASYYLDIPKQPGRPKKTEDQAQ